jgi:hypothetical protein
MSDHPESLAEKLTRLATAADTATRSEEHYAYSDGWRKTAWEHRAAIGEALAATGKEKCWNCGGTKNLVACCHLCAVVAKTQDALLNDADPAARAAESPPTPDEIR